MSELNTICYKTNFLIEVIVRIDFLNDFPDIDKRLPTNISNAIAKWFPIPEPRKAISKQINLTGAVEQKVPLTKTIEFTEWHFHSKDRLKELVILPNSAFIKYLEYKYFKELKDDFESIMNVLFEAYTDSQGKRLGLRYINEIKLLEENPFMWSDYLNKDLLGVFNLDSENLKMASRIFHNLEYNFDDFNLRYQFGMHNPDYPASIKKKAFILDYDAYFQGVLDEKKIKSNIDGFHSKIQDLFELSITDKLRAILNEEN